MKIIGTLKKKFPIEKGTSKNGNEWQKQCILLEQSHKYNKDVLITAFGDERIRELKNIDVGQDVWAQCYISSREYNGKWYHNIDGWSFSNITNSDINTDEESDNTPF
tara:strand:+ start:309 stop:629 length:321 start_codon:yes stop_codon:yes gene_type:complete